MFFDVGDELSNEEDIKRQGEVILPTSFFDAAKASLEYGAKNLTISGYLYDKTLDNMAGGRDNSQELLPEQLNEIYGDLVDIPFDSPMKLGLAKRVVESAIENKRRQAIISLGPQNWLAKVGYFGATVAPAVVDDLFYSRVAGNVLPPGLGVVAAAFKAAKIQKAADKTVDVARAIQAQTLGGQVAVGLTVAGAQEVASVASQQRVQEDTTPAANLTYAFAAVLGAAGLSKAFSSGAEVKAIETAVEQLDQGIRPDFTPITITQVKRQLPALPSDKPFSPIPLKDINTVDWYSGVLKKFDMNKPERGLIIDKDMGKGFYLTDAESVAQGVSKRDFDDVGGSVVKFNIEKANIIEADEIIAPKIKQKIIDKFLETTKLKDADKELFKEFNSMDDFYTNLNRLGKTISEDAYDEVLETMNQSLKNTGYQGIKRVGGYDHLQMFPAINARPHNVLMLFDANNVKMKSASKVTPKDLEALTTKEVEEYVVKVTSPEGKILDDEIERQIREEVDKLPIPSRYQKELPSLGGKVDSVEAPQLKKLADQTEIIENTFKVEPPKTRIGKKVMEEIELNRKAEIKEQSMIEQLALCGDLL